MRAITLVTVPLLCCFPSAWGQAQSTPAAAAPAVRAEDKCTIQGTVQNQSTGEAIKRAALVLRRVDRPGETPGSALSETDGTFVIRNLDPGRYILSASRNGFANQTYGSRGQPGLQGSTITLSAGQTLKDLRFTLTPHAVITGRVIDDEGEPMAYVSVQVMRLAFQRGKRQPVPMNQAQTNDLGEYRIFGLPAGRYSVQAKYTQRGMGGGQNDLAYQPAYYPNAAEAGAELQVTGGQTVRGIDFTLRRAQAYRVSGRVIDGASANASIMLFPKGANGFMGWERQPVMVRNGKFEIRGVLPGNYILAGEVYGTESSRSSARQSITVGNGNVENIELAFSPGVEIAGRVVYEDGAAAATASSTGANAVPERAQNVWLEPKDDYIGFGGGGGNGIVGEDGKFAMKNVGMSAYYVNLMPLPADGYIRAIRYGDVDVTDQGLDLSGGGGAAGELTIVVSGAGGSVDGTVENAKQEKPGGIQVVAVPEESKRGQARLFKLGTTDQNGHFELKGLAPGDYQIFGFEQIDAGGYQDAELLKRISEKGERVSVKAKGKETVSLKAVPAELTKTKED